MNDIEIRINDTFYNVLFESEPADRFLGTDIDFDIMEVYDARGGRQNLVFELSEETLQEMESKIWNYLHYGDQDVI